MPKLVKNSIRTFLFFALLIGANTLQAQKAFHVKIQIPPSMKSKAFTINYDNGVIRQDITECFINNELDFGGSFGSEYATLDIDYKVNDSTSYSGTYFINTKPVEFVFTNEDSSTDKNPFHHCRIKNAVDVYQSNIRNRLVEYSKDVINDMTIFMAKSAKQIGKVDSVTRKLSEINQNLNKRELQFVIENPNDYFSFWWFRTQIVPVSQMTYGGDSTQLEYLLHILNTVFPKKFTNTPEGLTLRTRLIGRLSVKKNTMAPDFESKDIHDKIIRLKDFRGQYVLLDFWATWCPPCMKEIPFLKQIRRKYPSHKLAMIGISGDRDYSQFLSVVKEKNMNWIHIFDKDVIPGLYGIIFYPTLFLINNEGVIIYDSKSQNKDDLLKALKEM